MRRDSRRSLRIARRFAWVPVMALVAAAAPAQEPVLRPPGVDEPTGRAIDAGLRYLARSQGEDGAWRSAGSRGDYPVAMTSLAGMAFLGSGSTTTRGRYFRNIQRAVDFLLRVARPDGLITSAVEERLGMFGHGFATLFLAEVYGMEEDVARQRAIHRVLTRAVALTAGAQSRAGGWYYTPDSASDEGSVTITQLQALRACRNAGILVPVRTVERAVAYIRDSANPDGGIRYRAGQGGPSRPAITAAAVAALYNAGEYDDGIAERALEFAVRVLPINGSGNGHHFYSQLYLAQALYQRGGVDWDRHYRAIADWLVAEQRRDGAWVGDDAGTVYGTAIAAIVLQLPFAYVSIYQR